MRLIDADKLIEAIKCERDDRYKQGLSESLPLYVIREVINAQPTILHTMHNGDISPSCATCGLVESLTEKLEERTAKKVGEPYSPSDVCCSACGVGSVETLDNFCWYCGAKFVEVPKTESTTGEDE